MQKRSNWEQLGATGSNWEQLQPDAAAQLQKALKQQVEEAEANTTNEWAARLAAEEQEQCVQQQRKQHQAAAFDGLVATLIFEYSLPK